MTALDRCAPIVALDFETSGYKSYLACAIGLVRVEGGEIVQEYARLIRPPSSQVRFTKIHGLRWSDLKDEEPFDEVWAEIADFMRGAGYLLAHNARFDRSVLHGCCEHFGVRSPMLPFLCTLKGARRQLRLRSCALNNLCDFFGIPLDHHNALSDARGCAQVFLQLIKLGLHLEDMLIA